MAHSLVLTNCTSRKRQGPSVATLPKGRRYRDVETAAEIWRSIYGAAPKVRAVRDLYMGRSFSDARKAARCLGGSLYAVSAGLGVAHEDDLAPSYDLTLADPSNTLALALAAQGWPAAAWWRALNTTGVGRGPIAALVVERDPEMILIALPSGYLDMIVEDLLGLSEAARTKLRIFSSCAGTAGLPPALREFALPYDERLEALAGHGGTRADFPQRALRHFVEVLAGHQLDLESARGKVSEALQGLTLRRTPARAKLSDDEIAAVLRQQWESCRGSSTLLLRYLRQEAQVACEQRRFRGIWKSLRGERVTEGAQS
jgi:hypothetical protein